ncbi:MAG: hypothetical protein AAFX76_11225 [Planctomycetota bacterium]
MRRRPYIPHIERKRESATGSYRNVSLRRLVYLLLPFAAALFLVSIYGPNLTPEGARRFSLISIMLALTASVLIGRHYFRQWVRQDPGKNMILSPEVMGALLGSIMTVILGGFVVNHMLEAAEERGQLRHVVRDHYQAKSELLDDFAHRGQKVLYYAYAYRVVEEWLMRYDDIEKNFNVIHNNHPDKRPGFGIGELDHSEAYDYYREMQKAFVEAGSMHGMCGQIEAMFFDGYRLSSSLMPQEGTADARLRELAQSGELRTRGKLKVQNLVDTMDEFLNPQTLRRDEEIETFAHASEELNARFRRLNTAYTELIETMRDDLHNARTVHLPDPEIGFFSKWSSRLFDPLARILR